MTEWKLNNKFNFEGREVRYGFEGIGPALVLVHGTPWSSFNLRHLISGLSDSFTVYYFDLLGYGQSDKSDADVSLGIQNKLLGALLNEWQLIPNSKLVTVPQAGHLGIEERPEILIREIKDFLNQSK